MRLFQFHNTHTPNMKFTTYIGCKEKCKHENYFIHTKVCKETTNRIGRVFIFAIFCRFNKQKMLVNNKNINVKEKKYKCKQKTSYKIIQT